MDEETDILLLEMIEHVREVYQQANIESTDRLVQFWEEFLKEDDEMLRLYHAGMIEEEDLLAWRRDMIVQSVQYDAMREALENDLIHADEIAAGVVNNNLPEIYSINRNWSQYDICNQIGFDFDPAFTLYDRYTVQRLLRGGNYLFPTAKIDDDIEQEWVRKKIHNSVTQGILQGESIDKIAKRLEGVNQMSYNSAVRTARTLTTSAQNIGREDSYRAALAMGIDLQKEWQAVIDMKTRDTHRHLDGVRVDIDQKFPNGCSIPGDPNGPAGEIYNCRCTVVSAIRGYEYHDDRWMDLPEGMTYEEWKAGHAYSAQNETETINNEILEQLNRIEPQKGWQYKPWDSETVIYENPTQYCGNEMVDTVLRYTQRYDIVSDSVENVDLSKLMSIQAFVTERGMLGNTADEFEEVYAVRYKGKLYLFNGNHRIALAKLSGITNYPIRVYNYG